MGKAAMSVAAAVVLAMGRMAMGAVLAGPVAWNGHMYYLLTPNSWTASEAEAETMGGHLATINDAAENQFIFQTFTSWGGVQRGVWIGLTDQKFPGPFVWIDGTPVAYTNWDPGEPDNWHGLEYWVTMHQPSHQYAGHWNDFKDASADDQGLPLAGVVEIVPEPGVAGVLAGAAVVWRGRRRQRGR